MNSLNIPHFIKIFLPKTAGDLNLLHVNDDLQLRHLLNSNKNVDIILSDNLSLNFDHAISELHPDVIILVFGPNILSYLHLINKKKNLSSSLFLLPYFVINNYRKVSNWHCINFTCEAKKKRLFIYGYLTGKPLLNSIWSRSGIKSWLFQNVFFQYFMPFRGCILSTIKNFNCLFYDIINEVNTICTNCLIEEIIISGTGVIIIKFKECIARIGITQEGNNRIENNVRGLKEIKKIKDNEIQVLIPAILQTGVLGDSFYCLETRVNGVDVDEFLGETNNIKEISKSAVKSIIMLNQKKCQITYMDKNFLSDMVFKPVNQLISHAKQSVVRELLIDMSHFVAKKLIDKEIPLVLSHGDYKLGNMKFFTQSKKIAGIIDWDHFQIRTFPTLDVYNLIITNEMLFAEVNSLTVLRNKVFPFNFSNWETKLLWDYFDRLSIPRYLERVFAIIYLINRLHSRLTIGPSFHQEPQWVDRPILTLAKAITQEISH